MGLQWEYEPEGFDFGGIKYLPDFRVQTGDLTYWYEVKPSGVWADRKFYQFRDLLISDSDGCKAWGIEARLLSGTPADVFEGSRPCPRCGLDIAESDTDFWDDVFAFCCEHCDEVTVSGGGNPPEIGWTGISYRPHKGWILALKADYDRLMFMVGSACNAARSARFEHGQCGAT
jgi:hypothetical protein